MAAQVVEYPLYYTPTTTAGGHNMHDCCPEGDIKQPLTIKRANLIEVLQGHLDDEKAKREEKVASQQKLRQRAIDAISKFSDDELENIFRQMVRQTSPVTDFEAWVEKAIENKTYVTPDSQPGEKESSLEKYVRVLGLATNDVIEVTPQDPVYPLL